MVAKQGTTVLASRTITFSRGAFRPGPEASDVALQPDEGVAERGGSEVPGVAVYPNPAHDVLHVALSSAVARELQLVLYNLMGQQVLSRVIPAGADTESVPMDLAQGVYLLRIQDGDVPLYSDKLVKQ